MNNNPTPYNRFLERYEDERVPWDDPAPPPEIVTLGAELPPGRALDLGCGYGRSAIFLAQHGWLVDGVDFIPRAIDIARQRAAAAGVAEQARFYIASAAALDFLEPPYDLAIDIGCMHSFTEDMLRAYSGELVRLLRPDGHYVLFAHLHSGVPVEEDEEPHGILEETVLSLMKDNFRLERVEHGITRVEDRSPWASGWFWFRRV